MAFLDETGATIFADEVKTYVSNTTVAKETGKGLSTNDYTTTEKNKLAGINKDLLDKLGESTEGNLTFNGDEINAAQMIGATSTTNGTSGTVPAPTAGQEAHILNGDGTWTSPLDNELIASKFKELDENKSDVVIDKSTGKKVVFTIENGIICAREA